MNFPISKQSSNSFPSVESPQIKEEIIEEVKQIVAQVLCISEVHLETSIQNMVEWDSLNHLRILTDLESRFNCTMKLDEISEVQSVQDWIDLILKYNEERNNRCLTLN